MNLPNRFILISLFFFLGCFGKNAPLGSGDPEWGVEVTWHGHSCFTFRDSLKRTVVIDPFNETVGYELPQLKADAVLITHQHFDHSYLRRIKRRRLSQDLVQTTGTHVMAGNLQVTGISSFHDSERGDVHGKNIIYTFRMGGLRFAHLGDIGHSTLSPYQLSALASVDVLFIPVGGRVTIGPMQAKTIVNQLKPKFVFPMHYGKIRFAELADVEEFLKLFPSKNVLKSEESTIKIRLADSDTEPHVFTLAPSKRNY